MRVDELDTPVLMVDASALERNIARMQTLASDAGLALRPHAKAHKSPIVANMQMAAGAVGVCCAKLGEAEVLGSEGVGNILITTGVVGESKTSRLLALARQTTVSRLGDPSKLQRLTFTSAMITLQ